MLAADIACEFWLKDQTLAHADVGTTSVQSPLIHKVSCFPPKKTMEPICDLLSCGDLKACLRFCLFTPSYASLPQALSIPQSEELLKENDLLWRKIDVLPYFSLG